MHVLRRVCRPRRPTATEMRRELGLAPRSRRSRITEAVMDEGGKLRRPSPGTIAARRAAGAARGLVRSGPRDASAPVQRGEGLDYVSSHSSPRRVM